MNDGKYLDIYSNPLSEILQTSQDANKLKISKLEALDKVYIIFRIARSSKGFIEASNLI